ncbi:hypothetical protein D3C80_1804390 [compost metagenome]
MPQKPLRRGGIEQGRGITQASGQMIALLKGIQTEVELCRLPLGLDVIHTKPRQIPALP